MIYFFFVILCTIPSTLAQFSSNDIEMLSKRLQDVKLSSLQFTQFKLLLSSGIALKEEIEVIKKNMNKEEAYIIDVKSDLLQKTFQKLLDMTSTDSKSKPNRQATIAAIQRGKKRKLEIQRQLEDEKLKNEHIMYVSNLRKLELVDGTIQTLRQRAISLELSRQHMKELDSLFQVYRGLEAQNIFNQTGLQKSRDYRLSLEKYIADHQNPLLEQKKRAEQLLQLSLQDISTRAQEQMKDPDCDHDLTELNYLLQKYYTQHMKVIEIQHKKSSVTLRGERDERRLTLSLKDNQGKSQNLKRDIEKYIHQLQYSSKCQVEDDHDEDHGYNDDDDDDTEDEKNNLMRSL